MKKNYPCITYQIRTDKGLEWMSEFPDINGVAGGGETAEEAIKSAYDNLKVHLDFLRDDGIKLPEPTEMDEVKYSGKMQFRTSKSLHRKIALISNREGVSINAYLNEAVIEKLTKADSEVVKETMNKNKTEAKYSYLAETDHKYSK